MSIINELSDLLSMETQLLKDFITSAPYRYKTYQIPKRNNRGFRTIAQPTKGLKNLQKIVYQQYLNQLPVHSACMAYVKNINIKDNALVHAKHRYLLKMDFKDFFPSIKPHDLIAHIAKYLDLNLCEDDKTLISQLFFYHSIEDPVLRLSIGAPTSPSISNTILYDFDTAIETLCLNKNISYSRYADDLAFSTNHKGILFDSLNDVQKTLDNCQYPTISINPSKTVFLSRKDNMHITGLVLTNDGKISIGRKKKRYIKSLVFQFQNHSLDAPTKAYLSGYLSYCLSVEPVFVSRLRKKFGSVVIDQLLQRN